MPSLWISLLGVVFGLGFLLGKYIPRKHKRNGGDLLPNRVQLLTWLDQAPVGWLMVDGQDRLLFINARAQRLLRIPASQTPPQCLAEMNGVTSLLDLCENVRDRHQSLRLEWDFANQELEVFAFTGQQESVALLMLSRRSLEAQLNQQERWVSDVAHELKTPLTALLLVGDSLAATVTDRNAVMVERLLRELRRMQELVGDLLELSRLENVLPGQGISQENILITDLLQEAWLGIKPLADEKNISYSITSHENGRRPLVYGDKKRLHRALLNLFDNALRFSPQGGTITVDLHHSSDWIRVGIRDEGPGLSNEDLEHMFERFYRGQASRVRHQRAGSGLGLAIVQQIILTHGGWVLGENHPRGGARFEIRLPLCSER